MEAATRQQAETQALAIYLSSQQSRTVQIAVLVFAVFTGAQIVELARAAAADQLAWSVVAGSITPLVTVLGLFSVLVATLTTIMIFLRLRTASLAEIQLSLAALEHMMTSQRDPGLEPEN